jgi:uncharacterized protein with GYD domain
MSTYIIFSKFSPETFKNPGDLKKKAETVSNEIKKQCPGVAWKESYATMGRFDVVDVVEADDPAMVEKAAMIIGGYGACTTETMHATPWKRFLDSL